MYMGLVKTIKSRNTTFLVYKYPKSQDFNLDPGVPYCQALYMNIKPPLTQHSYLGSDEATQINQAILWVKNAITDINLDLGYPIRIDFPEKRDVKELKPGFSVSEMFIFLHL